MRVLEQFNRLSKLAQNPYFRSKMAKRLGKAARLSGALWRKWSEHVLRHSSWVYVAIMLTRVLCLRITEALSLRSSHFDFRRKRVTIPGLKGQPQAKP